MTITPQNRPKKDASKTAVNGVHDAADAIILTTRSQWFNQRLITELDRVATSIDGNMTSRFGWMFKEDVEVLSAVAVPIGAVRDMHADGEVTGYHGKILKHLDVMTIFWLGLTGMILSLCIALCLWRRLSQERDLLEKDKGALRDMWSKAKSTATKARERAKGIMSAFNPKNATSTTNANLGGIMTQAQYELEMSKLGLMNDDGDLDDDEYR